MDRSIRDYARIGLTHHMLYPTCMSDPEEHVRTLADMARRDDIETLDCCLPYDPELRKQLVPLLRDCGKEIVYALHMFPIRKISLASTYPPEQGLTRIVLRNQIEAARSIGAVALLFGSGAGGATEEEVSARQAFAQFIRWLCREVRPYGQSVMLEPFDTDVDKKFLYGPTKECAELVQSLRPEVENLGIELDIAHVPLMHENLEDAIRNVTPYLMRIHLGNCVFKDTSDPLYGDLHPPMGIAAGEIDVPELVRVFRALLEIGYLNPRKRGALVLEITPFPGKTAEDTVADNFRRIDAAWEML